MAINVTPPREPQTLTMQVAEEIRVAMLRRRITGAKLAHDLGVSAAWVSYRLTGTQPIDLNDLQRIADVLGVGVIDLLPAAGDTRRYAGRPPIDPLAQRVVATIGQPRPPQRATLISRPATASSRLDRSPRPDRAEHRRRPVTAVAQADRSYASG
jgi:transcriptional regulator with XRE-family HTH domain